jgi:hypothetical protein
MNRRLTFFIVRIGIPLMVMYLAIYWIGTVVMGYG